jgi:hypothetical protein
MTEDEAQKKWCPFVRHNGEDGGTFNRGMGPDNATNDGRTNGAWMCNCIASQCMAWRWLPLMADDAFKNAFIKAAKDIGDTSENKHKAAKHVTENRAAYGLPVVPFDGFCGLAGRP